jgi:hypothetical protein
MEYGEVGELSSPLETLRSYSSVISLCSLDRTSYFVPLDTKYIIYVVKRVHQVDD